MLGISESSRFWYLRNFHDMRCKYERVLSVIHQQLSMEPTRDDIFIIMSKDQRRVRMFHYDPRSCCMHEKVFKRGYKFMKVEKEGSQSKFSISYDDVLLLLEAPVVKTLKIE